MSSNVLKSLAMHYTYITTAYSNLPVFFLICLVLYFRTNEDAMETAIMCRTYHACSQRSFLFAFFHFCSNEHKKYDAMQKR